MTHKKSNYQLIVCDGPRCCQKPGFRTLVQLAKEAAQAPELQMATFGCLGRCASGPNMLVRTVDTPHAIKPGFKDLDGSTYYYGVNATKFAQIVRSHCEHGVPIPGQGATF